MTVNI